MSHSIVMLHSSSDLYGSGKIFQKTVLQLKAEGYRPIVVLSEDGPMVPDLKEAGVDVRFVRLGILRRKYFNPLGLVNRIWALVSAYRQIKAIIEQERVSLLYTQSSGAIVSAFIKMGTGLPHIWHVLEITLKPMFLVRLTGFLLNRFADTVVVASGEVKRHWSQYVEPDKIQVIYNGVDADAFQSRMADVSENEYLEKLATNDNVVRVGMIGRVHWWKGQDYFLDIAKVLLDAGCSVQFVMAGDVYPGYEYLYEELEEKRRSLGIGQHVFDLGYVAEPVKFFQIIDIFIQPSILPDPFPTTVLEAMAGELPVVATKHGGAPEMVDDGATGYLVPWDQPKVAATAIKKLVENANLRSQFGKAGFQKLVTEFAKDNYHRGMSDLVRSYL